MTSLINKFGQGIFEVYKRHYEPDHYFNYLIIAILLPEIKISRSATGNDFTFNLRTGVRWSKDETGFDLAIVVLGIGILINRQWSY